MPPPKLIKLLSWHESLPRKAAALQHPTLTIDPTPLRSTSAVIGELAALNPAAIIFDLDRLPSNSRQIAIALRSSKAARHIPLLFAGGLPEKIAPNRAQLPDAAYATWPQTPRTLARLLKQPHPAAPITFKDTPSTTPLPQKLGIKPGMTIALLAAPGAFLESLGDLPASTAFTSRLTPATHLALCFIRSLPDLAAAVDLLATQLPPKASAWIIHPKRTGSHPADFHQNHVRDAALAANLVDYKVCSVDRDWSALKFAHRKATRYPRHPNYRSQKTNNSPLFTFSVSPG